MPTDLTVSEPLTATDIRAQVTRIQEVMKSVMQDGQHYGTIPGCGPKPTLLKAGAEKIMLTFRLAPKIEVLAMHTDKQISYQVTVNLYNQQGQFLGAGVGYCSSAEEKYAWREAVCKEEWDETDPADRRNKWKKGKLDKGKSDPYVLHQIRTHPPDVANTVLKISKKRGLIDAVLTVTATSDIFTQDVEDLPEEELVTKKSTAREKVAPEPATIDDSAWLDMRTFWEESLAEAFRLVKQEFKVSTTHDLPKEKRPEFAKRMREVSQP